MLVTKLSQKQRILNLLKDGRWHNVTELHAIAWRYGGRLFDLRQEGHLFEKRIGKNGLEEWRLTDADN